MEPGYALDITEFKEKGIELKKAIVNAVKDTQRLIIRPLPDKIIMTRKQYNVLSGYPEMMATQGQEFFLYNSGENVMEVTIK